MRPSLPSLLLSSILLLIVGCSGASADSTAESPDGEDTENEQPPPRGEALPEEGPGGEMILGLSVPSVALPGEKKSGREIKAPSRDRNDLIKEARGALDENRVDEAVSFADVLILLYPGDPEATEIRGRALLLQGDSEGGKQDLKTCCKTGRSSCCD